MTMSVLDELHDTWLMLLDGQEPPHRHTEMYVIEGLIMKTYLVGICYVYLPHMKSIYK